MTTERIDIVIAQTGAKEVRRDIEGIGVGAKSAAGGVDLLKNALKFVGIAEAVKETAGLYDAYTIINNRIRIFTKSAQELNAVEHQLFDISQRTRTDFTTNVQLYNRLAIAAKELGTNQSQLLTFTEAVAQATIIAGSAGESARGSLIQLSQAIGTTVVRAEEFNSILEGAPRIAQAAAAGLDKAGGSVARLRYLIVNQQVTSKEFFDALLTQADKLKAEFGTTTITIGQSFTQLHNALIQFVGESGQISGAARTLAQTISFIAQNLSTLASVVIALVEVFTVRWVAGLIATRAEMVREALAAAELAGAMDLAAAATARYNATLPALSFNLATATRLTQGLAAAQVAAAGTTAEAAIVVNSVGTATVLNATRMATFAAAAAAAGRTVLAFFGGPIGLIFAAVLTALALHTDEAAQAQQRYNEQQTEALGISGKLLTAHGKQLEIAEKQRDVLIDQAKANVELARTALLAAEAESKQLNVHNAFLVARAGFNPEEGPLTLTEQAGIQKAKDELAAQQKSLEGLLGTFEKGSGGSGFNNKTTKGRTKAQIIQEENELIKEQIKLLSFQGADRDVESGLASLRKKLREGQEKFHLDPEEEKLFKLRFESLQALKDQDEELKKIKGPQEEYARSLKALNQLVDSNRITTAEYTKATIELRIALLETATDAASGFERGLLKVRKEFMDTSRLAEDVVTNMAKNMEDALVEFARSGKLNFRSLIDSMINDLIRLQVRQSVTQPFFNFASDLFKGLNLSSIGSSTQQSAPVQGLGQIEVSDLPAFATGGSWNVGGSGGTDSQVVAFRASPDERVSVSRPGDGMGGMMVNVSVVNNVQNAGVQVNQRADGNGGKTIEILIDELVSKNIKTPGSKSSRALRDSFGLTQQTSGR